MMHENGVEALAVSLGFCLEMYGNARSGRQSKEKSTSFPGRLTFTYCLPDIKKERSPGHEVDHFNGCELK